MTKILKGDVVVLGGGPAGSVAAKRLAAAGVRVVLVGGASRPGWEGLSVRSRALLEEESLGSDAAFIEGPFTRRGTWASGRSVEGVEWLVERSRRAEALRSEAQSAGANCQSDRVATAFRLGGRWQVSLRSGRSLEAPILMAGIELAHRIRKRQFSFGRGRYRNFGSLKQLWDRALAW